MTLKIESGLGADWDQAESVPVVPSNQPSSLASRAAQDIETEARLAMRMLADKERRNIVLESPAFTRKDGVVASRAIFWDGAGPRAIRMYVEAYGDGANPVASFPFDFTSTGQKQPISVSIKDYQSFQRFAFRFAHEGVTLDLNAHSGDELKVASVPANAMLFHSDYGELSELLKLAGYMSSNSLEPDALLGAVRRFRADNELPGPNFVTLGDLFALRIVLGIPTGKTSLLPYVEWATAVGGAREKKQEEYIEPVADEILKTQADKLPESEDIYGDMDPPAEQDGVME